MPRHFITKGGCCLIRLCRIPDERRLFCRLNASWCEITFQALSAFATVLPSSFLLKMPSADRTSTAKDLMPPARLATRRKLG